MAQLDPGLPVLPAPGLGAPGIHAPGTTQQLRAIAWLRWRILVNGFRRKGGAGELIARIVVLPLVVCFALLPTAAAGFFSYTSTQARSFDHLAWILWGAFALTQVVNINLGQPGTTFDPAELIRFPMPLSRWVLVRLCFGLLGTASLLISLISVAVVVGITLAMPRLFLPALLALVIFGLANILFNRMIFAWVDRWLSTRRARELFTGFVFLLSLGFQALNARFNPGLQRGYHHRAAGSGAGFSFAQALAHRAHPVTVWLPPGLTASAIESAALGHALPYLGQTALCTAFAAFFLWVYTLRMRTEFRGENLSDAANLTQPLKAKTQMVSTPAAFAVTSASPSTPVVPPRMPPTLAPLLGKELLVLRRNTGLFYGLVAPAVMVFLFAGRMSSRGGSHWVLLGAAGYALLGVAPLSFNSLGLEGTGAQFYFMAPVPLREVFFAKNVFNLLIAFSEVLLVLAITAYVAGRPSVADCCFALLWTLATQLTSMTVGNRRSLAAPRKINPGRTMKSTQSPLSSYISLGIMLGCVALGFGVELLAGFLHAPWIAPVVMLACAAGAALLYDRGLHGIAAYALEHRDTLFEELGKKI